MFPSEKILGRANKNICKVIITSPLFFSHHPPTAQTSALAADRRIHKMITFTQMRRNFVKLQIKEPGNQENIEPSTEPRKNIKLTLLKLFCGDYQPAQNQPDNFSNTTQFSTIIIHHYNEKIK
jgi:hypothetical protein